MEHFSSYLCDHASLMGEEEPVRIEFVDESLRVCFYQIRSSFNG